MAKEKTAVARIRKRALKRRQKRQSPCRELLDQFEGDSHLVIQDSPVTPADMRFMRSIKKKQVKDD